MLQALAEPVPSQKFAPSISAKIAGGVRLDQQQSSYHQSLPQHREGNDVGNSLGTVPAFKRGEQSQNPRSATSDCARWLAAFFSNTPAKVIANDAGINLRAAENVKQGRNGLTMAHLENLCNSNHDFRVAWFAERCGGKVKASPQQIAAAYRLLNSIERGEFGE